MEIIEDISKVIDEGGLRNRLNPTATPINEKVTKVVPIVEAPFPRMDLWLVSNEDMNTTNDNLPVYLGFQYIIHIIYLLPRTNAYYFAIRFTVN